MCVCVCVCVCVCKTFDLSRFFVYVYTLMCSVYVFEHSKICLHIFECTQKHKRTKYILAYKYIKKSAEIKGFHWQLTPSRHSQTQIQELKRNISPSKWSLLFFIIQRVKARAIPCPHQPPSKGDNTVSVAQGGTATSGATKQLLPPDRVLIESSIYIHIYIYTPDQLNAETILDEMTECPIKPRQPTSIRITWHIQPFSTQSAHSVS